MNPAREALARAVNRAIASGSPVFTEVAPRSITITVKPVDGVGYAEAAFSYDEWLGMAPIRRALSIHEQCRAVLQGRRFEVISERLAS